MVDFGYDVEVFGIQVFFSMQYDKGDVIFFSFGQVCLEVLDGQIEVSFFLVIQNVFIFFYYLYLIIYGGGIGIKM